MKKISIGVCVLFLSVMLFAQSEETGTDRQAIKNLLKQYNSAVRKSDPTGTAKLFTADSKIYESGGSEGTYAHYLEHHLTPKLKEFKSFTSSDYKVEVQVVGNYPFTTGMYNCTIIVAKGNTEIKSNGVATSVLTKMKG